MNRTPIDVPHQALTDTCRRWRIVEMSLFGSILRDDFRPDSDVDVLVVFEPHVLWSLLDLVDLQVELTALFGRPVDIVEKSAIRNPFRRQSILTHRKVVYAA